MLENNTKNTQKSFEEIKRKISFKDLTSEISDKIENPISNMRIIVSKVY